MAYNGNYGQGDYGGQGGDFGQGDYNNQLNYDMKTEQFDGPSDWSQMRDVMGFGGGNGFNNDNSNGNPNDNANAEGQSNNDHAAPKDEKKKSRRSRSGEKNVMGRNYLGGGADMIDVVLFHKYLHMFIISFLLLFDRPYSR